MTIDTYPVRFGDLKQRILLGLLALDGGLVPKDRLKCLMWSEEENPKDPDGQIHGCVAGLRRAIRAVDPETEVQIETVHQVGYRLRGVPPAVVDCHRFRELAARARAALDRDPESAAELARSALDRWGSGPIRLRGGGPPFGVPKAQLASIVTGLRDEYQAALMTYLRAEIVCGRQDRLIPLLTQLATDDDGASCQELARLHARALDDLGNREGARKVLYRLEEVLNRVHTRFEEATSRLLTQLSDRPNPPQRPSACALQITDSRGKNPARRELRGSPDRIVVGRSAEGHPPPDIVVTSGSPSPVSRNHLFLDRREGAWWLTPNSKNGTYIRRRGRDEEELLKTESPSLDGRRHEESKGTRLRNGDVVAIRVRPEEDGGRDRWEMKFIDPQETDTIEEKK